jgi:hypothetical protein
MQGFRTDAIPQRYIGQERLIWKGKMPMGGWLFSGGDTI